MTPNIFAIAIQSLSLAQCAEIAANQERTLRDTIPCPPPDLEIDDEAPTIPRDTHYDIGETLQSAPGRTTAILPARRQSAA
jgi:hypothetical protein